VVEDNRLIPNHQFGFRQRHSTIEYTHRIVQRINEALENKQYCSAAFLDISQALDKVWHTGLLYKLRRSLLLNYFLILNFYLHSRRFRVKVETDCTELSSVNAGIPQGSQSQSQSYITTDSQSVCLGVEPNLGLLTRDRSVLGQLLYLPTSPLQPLSTILQ
jgi:hypothetical protein